LAATGTVTLHDIPSLFIPPFVDSALGDLTGTLWAKIMFAGNNKTIVEGLIADIEDAMTTNLQTLPWMDDTTRAAGWSSYNFPRICVFLPMMSSLMNFFSFSTEESVSHC
jgi:hypothetical protein